MSNKISLKEYFNIRVDAIEKSIEVAHEEMNRRLEGMNEFRKQLDRQSDDFFSRSEHELFRRKVEEDIQGLREFRSEMRGKASQSSVILSTLLAVGGLLLASISIVLGFFGK